MHEGEELISRSSFPSCTDSAGFLSLEFAAPSFSFSTSTRFPSSPCPPPPVLCHHLSSPVLMGPDDLIVDPHNFEWIREANCPVIADITHALQQPDGRKLEGGGVASGGLRELIPCIARTAVRVDGFFMEVHDEPLNAPLDGPTQWVSVCYLLGRVYSSVSRATANILFQQPSKALGGAA